MDDIGAVTGNLGSLACSALNRDLSDCSNNFDQLFIDDEEDAGFAVTPNSKLIIMALRFTLPSRIYI
jgi:hypothetical protein